VGYAAAMSYATSVILAAASLMTLLPMMTLPITIFSVVLLITSIVLALFVLMHKGRGGGLSDLFGGGISSSMGGSSVAERNLDRLTIIIGVVWLASIVALGLLYKLTG
jgi:preprotein translocase subunit SecG